LTTLAVWAETGASAGAWLWPWAGEWLRWDTGALCHLTPCRGQPGDN